MAKTKRKAAATPVPGEPVQVRIAIRASDDTPSYYVNHVEVSATQHEFTLSAAKIRSTISPEKLAEAATTRVIELETMLQLMIPPTLMHGLIKALQIQLDLYEKANGKVRDNSGIQQVTSKNERLN